MTDVPNVLNRPEWLDEVEVKLGRPIRVLNLGNIANNAFQNAKIMRRAGIDADCVAYDYYHVMGTAQWEDADYRGDIGDQFYPDWWRVKMINYAVPDWFVQGPKTHCLDYLHARYKGEVTPDRADEIVRLRRKLDFETQFRNYIGSNLNAPGKNPVRWFKWALRKLAFKKYTITTYIKYPELFYYKFSDKIDIFTRNVSGVLTILAMPFVFLFLMSSRLVDRFIWILSYIPKAKRSNLLELRRSRRTIMMNRLKARMYPVIYAMAGVAARMFRLVFRKRFGLIFGDERADRIGHLLGIRSLSEDRITVNMSVEEIQKRRAQRKAKRLAAMEADHDQEIFEIDMEERIEDEKLSQELDEDACSALHSAYLYYLELAYPDQAWILDHYERYSEENPEDLRKDVIIAKILAEEWEGIFEYYDIVLAYSTDGILPMAGCDMPFFTYEHGTLRSIPFENSTMGRLCATSYRTCNQLMITNLDNVDKPPKLAMRPDQVIYLPHAVDDRKLLGFRHQHIDINPTDHERPMFLCPARHDWGDDDPSLMKGNDKVILAVKMLYDEGHRPRVVMFDWGRHVEKSKKLINSLGIGDIISWVKPMKKVELWKSYFRCHAIVDQFSIPAFGGVTFEGLIFSKRVITYIDEEQSTMFFGELPPVMNCSTPETIAEALRVVIYDPEDRVGIGAAGGRWAKTYHSSQRILDLQLSAFEPVVKESLFHDMSGEFLEKRTPYRVKA